MGPNGASHGVSRRVFGLRTHRQVWPQERRHGDVLPQRNTSSEVSQAASTEGWQVASERALVRSRIRYPCIQRCKSAGGSFRVATIWHWHTLIASRGFINIAAPAGILRGFIRTNRVTTAGVAFYKARYGIHHQRHCVRDWCAK